MKKELKLSKGFENVIIYYANQKKELEDKRLKLLEAEREVLKDILVTSGLGDGNYKLEVREDGLYLVSVPDTEISEIESE